MIVSRGRLMFYAECKFKQKRTESIHKIINYKVDYDPFNMTVKGTKRHNSINLLRMAYRNYLRGYSTKEDFLYKLNNKPHLIKYIERFSK